MSVPAATGVAVWWATVRPVAELDLSALSREELARVDRLAVASAQQRSALARVLLRAALADVVGGAPASFAIDWDHGPLLARGGPSLSLSHSADRVVVAVSEVGDVGVDIEPAARGGQMRASLVDHLTTDAERAALAELGAGRDDATIQLWTAKEAVLKATRDGLRLAPKGVEVLGLPSDLRLTVHEHRRDLIGSCHLSALALDPDYVGTVALLAGAPTPVDERDGNALLS